MRAWSKLLLFACVPVPALAAGAGGAERLAASGLSLPFLWDFKVESDLSYAASGLKSEELSLVSAGGEKKARVVLTSAGSHGPLENLLRARKQELLDHYGPKNLANGKFKVSGCRPKAEERPGRLVFRLFADAKLRFGLCEQKEARYAAIAAFVLCPGRVFELYFYFPKGQVPKDAAKELLRMPCPGAKEET